MSPYFCWLDNFPFKLLPIHDLKLWRQFFSSLKPECLKTTVLEIHIQIRKSILKDPQEDDSHVEGWEIKTFFAWQC